MSNELKITETFEHFVAEVKRFYDQTERGDFDDLTSSEFSDRLLLVHTQASTAIYGISILLIKSGMADPNDDMSYSREIGSIAHNAGARYSARQQQKENL